MSSCVRNSHATTPHGIYLHRNMQGGLQQAALFFLIPNIRFLMTHELLTTIIGYAAAVCMVCGYMPQAIYTIRTRDTDGIATPTFLLLGAGSVFFMIQGVLISNLPLFLTNAITTVCSAIIFGIKIYNDHWRKRS